jgi:hypothetical protein
MSEDSFWKTAMSRREDILGSINVTVMDRSANTARASSNSGRPRAGRPYSISGKCLELPYFPFGIVEK